MAFRADEMQVFLGCEIWQGAGYRKQRKTLCFQTSKLKLKKKSPFQPIVKKRFLEGQRGSGALAGVHQNAARWWGGLTNGWVSRPRAITFRRKNCVAAAKASEVIVNIVNCRHGCSRRFWPCKVNLCFTPTKHEFFRAVRFGGGPVRENIEKSCMFHSSPSFFKKE